MKRFVLKRPRTLAEALAALPSERPRDGREPAKLLAGGQDLLTELKEHLAEPESVIDLKGVAGLDRIEERADGGLVLGALVRLSTLAADARVRARFPALAEAAESVGSPQIRSQGTLGGNLCQRPRCWYWRLEEARCLKKGGAECFSYFGRNKYNAILGGGPSYIVHPSDLAPAAVALDASVRLASPRGERTLALERFFTLPSEGSVLRENVLEPDELVLALELPPTWSGKRSSYLKERERGSFDFALASVACALEQRAGECVAARLVLGGVAPIPWRVRSSEAVLVGSKPSPELFARVAEDALKEASPLSENAYKVPLARALVVRALEALAHAG